MRFLIFCLSLVSALPASPCEFYSNSTGTRVGTGEGNRIYDSRGRMRGMFNSGSVYKADGSIAGSTFGIAIYDSKGTYLGKISEGSIVTSDGSEVGFERECTDPQAGAGALLLLLKK